MHASCPRLFARETRCSSATSVSRFRSRHAARWSVAAFLRAPFWTTVLVIFSPIPDSAVRILAPLGKYPLPLYLGAVALGRFPRLLLIAGTGALLSIPLPWLLVASGGVVLAGLAWRHRRSRCASNTQFAPSAGCCSAERRLKPS